VFRLVPRNHIAGLSYLAADTHPVVSTIAEQVRGIPLVRASAEEVLSLHPDLVLTYENTNVRLRQQLQKAAVPVLEVPWAQSLADVQRITGMLGERLGASRRAAALIAEMDSRLATSRMLAAKPPARTLVYEPNGYLTAGGVSDEVLKASGLDNIAASLTRTRSGTLPIEAVLAAQPDLLVLNDSSEQVPARANLVLHHPALAAIGNHSLVVRLSLTPLLCPGPWSADIADDFAALGNRARSLAQAAAAP